MCEKLSAAEERNNSSEAMFWSSVWAAFVVKWEFFESGEKLHNPYVLSQEELWLVPWAQ